MNEEYWKEYYKTHSFDRPSQFAEWARIYILNDTVYDIGCGNGRDTAYLNAIGVDPNVTSPRANMIQASVIDFLMNHDVRNATLYARWFFHAVEENVEDYVLSSNADQLLAEFRVHHVHGDWIVGDHERRLIEPEDFIFKLRKHGWKIKYSGVARGWSVKLNDDPLLMRVNAVR